MGKLVAGMAYEEKGLTHFQGQGPNLKVKGQRWSSKRKSQTGISKYRNIAQTIWEYLK